MQTLANISTFENLQANANAAMGIQSEVGVFNVKKDEIERVVTTKPFGQGTGKMVAAIFAMKDGMFALQTFDLKRWRAGNTDGGLVKTFDNLSDAHAALDKATEGFFTERSRSTFGPKSR